MSKNESVGCILFCLVISFVFLIAVNQQGGSGKKFSDRSTEFKSPSLDIRVESLTVKKVSGKFRYFFQIRNHDSVSFQGDIKISLKKANGNSHWNETFSTGSSPIQPNIAKVVYTDAHTGPPSVHGENGYTTFGFEATSRGRDLTRGSGKISWW